MADKLIDLALPYQRKVLSELGKKKVQVLNFSRQIGKSWTAAFSATAKCCTKPNALVIYLSTGLRAANEAIRTCGRFADAVNTLTNGQMTYTANASCLTYANGSRILSLPGNPASCRGWSADLLICDEMAFWQQPDECWQAIIPTILNPLKGSGKHIIICSTPLGRNSLFYDLCQRAKYEHDWGYYQTTIHDAIKDGLKADIDQLHKLIPDPYQFAQEFECQFAEKANVLVPINDLQFKDTDENFEEVFMGADWARTSDGTAIAVIGRKGDRLKLIDLLQMHNVEYSRQVEAAKQMFRKWMAKCPVRLFYGDATGLGGPLMEQLNRECSTLIKPFTFNHNNKNVAYEYFRKCVFDRRLEFDSQFKEAVVEDCLLVQQMISEDGKVTYSATRKNNSHADVISAIILALQAENECRRQMTTPMMPFSIGSVFY